MADHPNPNANPFVGPRALESGEPIFGREPETRKLANLLLANRIILLYSPSGAGKTSLIQAALVPRLKARNFNMLPVIRLNQVPSADLADQPGFNPYVYSALASLEEGRPKDELLPHQELARMSLDEYLSRQKGSRRFLIFDQFEEVLTINPLDREGKLAFFEQLGEALSQPNLWALFAIREDYLGGLAPYTLPIPTRFKDTFRLDLLEADAARQVVQSTAELGHVHFTDEAADQLIDDLTRVRVQLADGSFETQSGLYVEPVHLQVVCRDLWEKRDPNDPDITPDEIEKIGDVDDALGSYYDSQAGSIAEQVGLSEWKVRNWCGARLITESDIRSQVLMGQEESGGLANTAIQKLVNAHLVRREPRRGGIWFELAHDRLITPIRRSNARWSEEHLSPWRRQAALWETERRPDHLLLAGQVLDEAIEWAGENAGQLSEEEAQFLEASKRRQQALQLDAERRRAQTQRRFLYLIGLALVVAVALGIYSALQTVRVASQANALETANVKLGANALALETANAQAQNEKGTAQAERVIAQAERDTADALRLTAEAQSTVAAELKATAETSARIAEGLANIAFARQLAAQGGSLLDTQPGLAGMLAAESFTISPTWESRGLLLDLAQLGVGQQVQPFGFPIPEPESLIMALAVSPDGEHLAWGTQQGFVGVWNYRTNKTKWNKRLHTGNVISLAFSPDGQWLASGGVRPELHITNVSTGREVKDLSEDGGNTQNSVDNRVYALAFHPKEPWLAAAVLRRIYIWRTGASWELESRLPMGPGNPREPDWIQELAWSPDGGLLASGEFADTQLPNGGLVVWDPLTGQKKLSVEYERSINGLAWSPDGGETLTVGSSSGEVRRWDMNIGREITPPVHRGADVYGISISPDGKILAVGGLDRSITLYNTRDSSVFWRIPNPSDEFVRDLQFVPRKGSNLLVTMYENVSSGRRRITLYAITPQNPISQEIAFGTTPILGIGGSLETGLRLLRSTKDGILVEELSPGGQGTPQTIFQQTGTFNASAISQEGDHLALWGRDGSVSLYALPSGEQTGTFTMGTLFGQSMAISPDGSRLAFGVCMDPNSSTASDCMQGEIHLRDAQTGQPISFPLVHPPPSSLFPGTNAQGLPENFITALTFNTNGSRLASAGQGRNIQIWDLTDFTAAGVLPEQHTESISSLAFSPDGSALASGSADGSLILWDLEGRLPLGSPLLGGHGGVSALVYQPDGSLLAGYADGALLQWLITPDNLLEIACSKSALPLTQLEQEQYFPEGGYQNACGK